MIVTRQPSVDLHVLAERIHAVERRGAANNYQGHEGLVKTGWFEVDSAIGGLGRGLIHELFSASVQTGTKVRQFVTAWTVPLGLLQHLARQAVRKPQEGTSSSGGLQVIVCIGNRCWPFLPPSRSSPHVDGQMMLVNPPDVASRVWAVDLAMRCPAVAAVIADGTGFTMAVTRRLQLAAAQGGVLGLIARPPWEECELSAAATRWRVQPVVSDHGPGWSVELLRRKGLQPTTHFERGWVVELPT